MREITFRGDKSWKNYFEGWYFKCVDAKNDLIVILIPGMSHFKEKMAFLQYIIHLKGNTYSGFIKYDLDDFEIREPFYLKFEDGHISKEEIILKFEDIELSLQLSGFTPLQNTWLSPSIMGYFEYLKMPCYHDIVSLNHDVKGYVNIKGEEFDFEGKGYIEGDRGKNFPAFYIWAQCNHFKAKEDSLFLSVADISTPLFQFLGHIAVYYHEGREYRFASYLGSKVKVDISEDKRHAKISFQNKKHLLEIEIWLNQGNTLIAPMNEDMDFKIKEQVKSRIQVRFDSHEDESEFCASELVNWNV